MTKNQLVTKNGLKKSDHPKIGPKTKEKWCKTVPKTGCGAT